MFGHPTRNALAQVTPNSRFLYDNAYSCMVTRYRPFSKILKYVGIAVEVTSFSHREIDECSIKPGQCAYCAIGCGVSPCKVGLSDFEDTRNKGMEQGSLSRISLGEGLIPNIEPSFLCLANIEVPVITPTTSG